MKTFKQALESGYKHIDDGLEWPVEASVLAVPNGHWSFEFGDSYELIFEPLFFGNYYVALYKNGELLTEKIPIKPGKE